MHNQNIVNSCIDDKCENCSYVQNRKPSHNENIIQLDGEDDISANDDDDTSDDTIYGTEDEAFSESIPAVFSPVEGQDATQGEALRFDANLSEKLHSIPLCLVLNARSVYNKKRQPA